ncbi:MAG: hypothetical protein V8S39_02720 [Lachnospiraceae bacterium]
MRKKRKKWKYINGTKGVISLFLVIIMMPFFSIITVFTDMARYNSSVNIMREVMGVAANSTLANYDTYLQDRFGLYAVDQKTDINSTYNSYLENNGTLLNNTLNIDSSSIDGNYALSDVEVLYNQIMEYSKLNAPTTVATDLLNVFDFISQLEKKVAGLKEITNLISSAFDTVDKTITLLEKAEELKGAINEFQTTKSNCDTAYNNMNIAVKAVAAYLETERPEVDLDNDSDEDEKAAKKWDDDLAVKRYDYTAKRTAYVTAIGNVKSELTNIENLMNECNATITGIAGSVASVGIDSIRYNLAIEESNLSDIEKKLKEMSDAGVDKESDAYKDELNNRAKKEIEVAELQSQKSAYDAEKKATESLTTDWDNATKNYSDVKLQLQKSALDTIITNINNLAPTDIDKDIHKYGLDDATYKCNLESLVTANDIQAYLDKQNSEGKNESGFYSLVKGLTETMDSLFKAELFYDTDLSACINTQFYTDKFGGLPAANSAEGGVYSIVRDLGAINTGVKNIIDNFSSFKLLSLLNEIKNLLVSINKFYTDIINFMMDIINNIRNLFTGYGQIYTSMYMAYNLPCRTTLSGKTMTGYSYGSIGLPDQGPLVNAPIIGNIAALANQIDAIRNGTGDDYTFSGAELEYILFGSTNEIANQLYVFTAIYLLRMVLDLGPICTSVDVQAMAAAATIGYGVVMALVIIVEPFLDTVVLVNGGTIPVYKTSIFLTPSGLPGFIEKVLTFEKFTTVEKENIKGKLINSVGATQTGYDYEKEKLEAEGKKGLTEIKSKYLKGLIDLNYQQYSLLLLAVTVTKERQTARLCNLIQMETYQHYKDSYEYDIRKSYTYLAAKTQVTMKQTMTGLLAQSLFTKDLTAYRGY